MAIGFPKRATLVRKLISAAREGDSDYTEGAPAKIDWGLYDLAQTREIGDSRELTRHLVDAAEGRFSNRTGRRVRKRGDLPAAPRTLPRY